MHSRARTHVHVCVGAPVPMCGACARVRACVRACVHARACVPMCYLFINHEARTYVTVTYDVVLMIGYICLFSIQVRNGSMALSFVSPSITVLCKLCKAPTDR